MTSKYSPAFYQIDFVENQILQEQNQFSWEISHALENTKFNAKYQRGFSKYMYTSGF